MTTFRLAGLLMAPFILAAGPSQAEFRTKIRIEVPQVLKDLEFQHPASGIVEQVVRDFNSRDARLESTRAECNAKVLRQPLDGLRAIERALINLVAEGGGNIARRRSLLAGVKKVQEDAEAVIQARLKECEEQRQAAIERSKRAEERLRREELERAKEPVSFEDTREAILPGNRLAVAALRRGAANAARDCDIPALQRLLDQANSLLRNEIRKGGEAGSAERARTALNDSLVLSNLITQLREQIDRCRTLRDAGIGRGQDRSADQNVFRSDGLFGGGPGVEANISIGGVFRSGSNNNGGSASPVARNFQPVTQGDSLAGVNTNLNVTVDLGNVLGNVFGRGGSTYFATDVNFSVASGTSSGSSAPTDIAYIPYVNSNPAVGLGASGQTATVKTTHTNVGVKFTIFQTIAIANGHTDGASLWRPDLAANSADASRDIANPLTGRRMSFLFRPGRSIKLIIGAGLETQFERTRDEVSMASITPGATSDIDSRVFSSAVYVTGTVGLKGYHDIAVGKLFWTGLLTVAGGLVHSQGEANQQIAAPGLAASPSQSDNDTRPDFSAALTATVGVQLGNVIVGVSGQYRFRLNQPLMRLPVGDGRAGLAFRNSHAGAVMAFVKIKLY